MPLDRLPRTARGDAELLVVIADRATGRERVTEPELATHGDLVRGVRERGGALVGRNDEVAVLAVPHAHAVRVDGRAVRTQVVGDVQHR